MQVCYFIYFDFCCWKCNIFSAGRSAEVENFQGKMRRRENLLSNSVEILDGWLFLFFTFYFFLIHVFNFHF